jgi:hypothetical protein
MSVPKQNVVNFNVFLFFLIELFHLLIAASRNQNHNIVRKKFNKFQCAPLPPLPQYYFNFPQNFGDFKSHVTSGNHAGFFLASSVIKTLACEVGKYFGFQFLTRFSRVLVRKKIDSLIKLGNSVCP